MAKDNEIDNNRKSWELTNDEIQKFNTSQISHGVKDDNTLESRTDEDER